MSAQLQKQVGREPNPFSASPPKVVGNLSPELADFLREQAENLRRGHNINQAGDSQFPWELLTEPHNEPVYTLGALGRFKHPDYGIIHARYVQFVNIDSELELGSPFGLDRTSQKFAWRATNQLSFSAADFVLGFGASFTMPTNGQYGWLICNGVNIQQFLVDDKPGLFWNLSWSASGLVGLSALVPGPPIAKVVNSESTVDGSNWIVPPAGAYIDTLSFREATAAGIDIPAIESLLANLQQQINTIEQRVIDRLRGTEFDLSERITTIDRAEGFLRLRIEAVAGTGQLIQQQLQDQLQIVVNAQQAAVTASGNAIEASIRAYDSARVTNENKRITTFQSTAAGTFAESASTSANEATIQNSLAGISASAAALSESNAATSATDSATSASAALLSETNASTSASNAATSEGNAATSESNAATSESNAATSASQASTSETNAAGSASSASTSASNAASSAATATTQAGIATTQAGNASTSAGSAATSASNAAGSASSASTSASNAASSASTATTQAGIATTQAGNASTSAGAAATSASNAAGSASSASTSASNAASSASTATTQAGIATTQAGNASTSAGNASTSAGAAATSETNAAGSASSASTSASNAANSASAASGSAGAASTSASAANTSASNAASSASSASGSASTATTQASNASVSAGNAATSASTASTSATNASTSASNASTSATVAATAASSAQSVANRLLPDKPGVLTDFADDYSGTWTPDTIPTIAAGTPTTVTGEGLVWQYTAGYVVIPKGWAKVSTGRTFRNFIRARVTVNSGTPILRTGFMCYTAAGVFLGAVGFVDHDSNFVVADGWEEYTNDVTSTAILASYPTAVYVRGYCQLYNANPTWQLSIFRFRDETDFALVTTMASAMVDVSGNAIASWSTTTVAGGASAAIRLESKVGGSTDSTIALEAQEFQVWDGTTRKLAMKISNLVATFMGDLNVNGSIQVGTRRIPIALQSFQVLAGDGETISYGTNLVNIPRFLFDTSGLAAKTAAQVYDVQAQSVTATQFVMRAKILTPGVTAVVTSTGGTNVGGTPAWQLQKSDAADAYNGLYTFNVTMTINFTFEETPGNWVAYAEYDCYVRPSGGAWTYIGTVGVDVVSASSGSQSAVVSGTFNFGSAIGQHGSNTEFGAHQTTSHTITAFGTSYTKQSTSGVSSATPSGEKVIVTVIPQNI